jgi:hypothetical protein
MGTCYRQISPRKDPKQNGQRTVQQIVEHMSTPLVL